ncbi:unnamed protein product, partial [Prunus brigantina]
LVEPSLQPVANSPLPKTLSSISLPPSLSDALVNVPHLSSPPAPPQSSPSQSSLADDKPPVPSPAPSNLSDNFSEELLIVSHAQKVLKLPNCFNRSESHMEFSVGIARCIFLGEKEGLPQPCIASASSSIIVFCIGVLELEVFPFTFAIVSREIVDN